MSLSRCECCELVQVGTFWPSGPGALYEEKCQDCADDSIDPKSYALATEERSHDGWWQWCCDVQDAASSGPRCPLDCYYRNEPYAWEVWIEDRRNWMPA